MIRYHTSLRCRPAEETLSIARDYARDLGIVRVTDITWLDQVGMPVCASIRPEAMPGGLCVNSGKGFTPLEARVGAYMEAIEFALAEPNRAGLTIVEAAPPEIYEGADRLDAILDFCPRWGAEIDSLNPLECVEATEMTTGAAYLVPAELVFFPFTPASNRESLFSASTNGLSSGNNRTEALIHGLLEVIERDVLSFHFVYDHTLRVDMGLLPGSFAGVLDRLRRGGLELIVRYAPNEFDMPVFLAFLIDASLEDPMFINAGYGCHTDKTIALSRAVAEALQSRLVLIHGSRDDIPQSHEVYAGVAPGDRRKVFQGVAHALRKAGSQSGFGDLAGYDWPIDSLEAYAKRLLDLLSGKGFHHVLAVPLTRPEAPLQVMRTLVPGMEFFNEKSKRLGRRLRDYATHVAHQTVRGPQP